MFKKITISIFLTLLVGLFITIQSPPCYADQYTDNEPTVTVLVNGIEELANVNRENNGWGYYNLMVDNEVSSIKIKIDASSTSSALTLDGQVVSSGAFIVDDIPLIEGNNPHNIGVDSLNYKLYIYKVCSDNVYGLSELHFYPQDITFDPNILTYDVTVKDTVTTGGISVITNNIGALVKINDNPVTTLNPNELGVQEIPLNYGSSNQVTILVESIIWDTKVNEKTYTINITRNNPVVIEPPPASGGGGGGGGGGSSSSASTTIELNTNIDISTSTATVSITQEELTSLLKLLETKEGAVKLAVIQIPTTNILDNYKIQLPISAFTSNNTDGIKLETGIGSLTVMDTMLQNTLTESTANNVEIMIGKVDTSTLNEDVLTTIGDRPVIRLNLAVDGVITEWSNENSPVIVSIPYTPTAEELLNPEKIVIYYIDGAGNVNTIPNGEYDSSTRNVVFSTTHFSDYAIAFNNKQFTDIADQSIKHAVEVLAAKGIVNGKTETTFSPNDTVTRAEFITLLDRAFELSGDVTNNFTDVSQDKYYYETVGTAKELGIVNGIGNNEFNPNGLITKTQVETIINNTIKSEGIIIDNLTTLLSEINDNDNITRGEICLIIYNMIK
jgi:hypothetical protein